MKNVRIQKAEKLGLCFGVRRAVKLLKEAASEYGEIGTLGPVAHNRLLVETLANLEIRPITHLDQARNRILAITTHGVSPSVLAEIETRHIRIIDTTCPIVRRAQDTVKKLADTGFDVFIFGDATHSEVKGLLGWAGNKGAAALNINEICKSGKPPSRLGIVSQTTQRKLDFVNFAKQLMDTLGPNADEIRLVNTLCKVTQGQQEAALRLAQRSQVMIVMGGANSANARHLVETCFPFVETHLVETADEVDTSWFVGRDHIGITAGASTPDEAVEELMDRLRSL